MTCALLASEEQLAELGGNNTAVMIHHVRFPEEFIQFKNADLVVDLLFEHTPERLAILEQTEAGAILVNDVVHPIGSRKGSLVRLNAWPGFLKNEWIEASSENEGARKLTENLFAGWNKKMGWCPDLPGFVAPRVISLIINEAYISVESGISGREEIDTAMKTGTNYPYGPFEWARLIGPRRIAGLLTAMSKRDPKYQPCQLLEKDANES